MRIGRNMRKDTIGTSRRKEDFAIKGTKDKYKTSRCVSRGAVNKT